MRILLAEDDPVIADGICRALRRGGCAVDHVADGMEADAALAGQAYDLLILDLGLPRMNGIDVLKRLRDYRQDVWRFRREDAVPFTNNVAEQALRMPKVKQKVSGCFRTVEGAHTYCAIRSYAATLHKQGMDVFAALVCAFKGDPIQPALG